jgi:hypothetical protein
MFCRTQRIQQRVRQRHSPGTWSTHWPKAMPIPVPVLCLCSEALLDLHSASLSSQSFSLPCSCQHFEEHRHPEMKGQLPISATQPWTLWSPGGSTPETLYSPSTLWPHPNFQVFVPAFLPLLASLAKPDGMMYHLNLGCPYNLSSKSGDFWERKVYLM